MTDKQIIYNVNVSKCEYYKEFSVPNEDCDEYNDVCECSITESAFCFDECNHNCYYKQLKRKEQECEELKKTSCKFKNYCTCDIEKLLQTLTEIKEIAEREVKHAPDGETFARPEIKQILQKISKCEVGNKLNSNIERMNEQNEKLHNENKELKLYIKEDLVPHTQIYIGLINRIKQQMKTILMVSTNGKYRPVKNSTKEQCYQVLGNIQDLLKTNIITTMN